MKSYGGTVAVTAAALAAAAAASHAKQEAEAAAQARRQYVDETMHLLTKSMNEIRYTPEMEPSAFQREFQPRFQRVMGQLDKSTPPPDLAARHQQLIRDLDKVGKEIEELMRTAELGDVDNLALRIKYVNDAWSEVLKSNIEWFKSASA